MGRSQGVNGGTATKASPAHRPLWGVSFARDLLSFAASFDVPRAQGHPQNPMLQKLSDSLATHKWFWYTILGALALVFAAWGAYGIVNLNFGGASWAAKANGQTISLEAARNAWLNEQGQIQQQFGGNLSPEVRKHLQNEVLEGMIREALMAQRTEKLGYRVSQADLLAAIRAFPAFQVGGQYSAQAAAEVLAEHNVSLTQFSGELMSDLRRQQLVDGIRSSDFLTPTELARAQALQNEQRQIQYLVFPASQYQSDAPIAPAAIQAYYQSHQAKYRIAESVDLRYGELTLAQVAAGVQVSDADVAAAYQKHLSEFVVPERREASHILISFGKDPKAALAQAEHVLKLAQSGQSFAALAKQYSADPGSARKGGSLGWVGRDGFVKPFADALFAIPKVGDIVGPVKSRFGYHIIRLDGIQPGHTKTLAEARPELIAQLSRSEASDRFGDIEDRLQNQAQSPDANFAAIAKTFNLTTGEIPLFVRGTGAAPLGVALPVQNLVFGSGAIAPGTIGGPVILDNDKMVIVEVVAHHGPQVKPLAEVQANIVTALTQQRENQAALAAAQAARDKLLAGESFEQVARALKQKADPAKFIGRDDPSVPASVGTIAFGAPKPDHGPVYVAEELAGGGAALVAVTAVRSGQTDNPVLARALAQRQIEGDGAGDVAAYIAQMRATAKVAKNPNAFQ